MEVVFKFHPRRKNMTIYYVATRACYVLVEAENETQAEILGRPAIHDLYAEQRERLGREVPIHIVTIRPASSQEPEFCLSLEHLNRCSPRWFP